MYTAWIYSNENITLHDHVFGEQVIQLVTAVMYCLLESLAASLNPQNDHWRLRDEAAYILACISR